MVPHSIPASIANLRSAIRQQQTAEIAQNDRDLRRRMAMRRAEEIAREAVRETDDARENPSRRSVDKPPPVDNSPSHKHRSDIDSTDSPSPPHLDLFV